MKTMSGVAPTRMELLRLKKRVALARKGHELLKEKMDALVMEFVEILRKIGRTKRRAFELLSVAHRSLSKCLASMGTVETEQASRETRKELQVDLSTRFVMGVSVPTVEIKSVERDPLGRGYSVHTTSSLLDEASRDFERAFEVLVQLAELEEAARAVGRELEKTKRRVNALEYILIPRLEETIKFIVLRLDEMERENFVRMKRIKLMLERRAEGE